MDQQNVQHYVQMAQQLYGIDTNAKTEESEKMTDEKEELTTKNITNLPLNTRFAADTTSCQIGGTHYHAWQTVKSQRKY